MFKRPASLVIKELDLLYLNLNSIPPAFLLPSFTFPSASPAPASASSPSLSTPSTERSSLTWDLLSILQSQSSQIRGIRRSKHHHDGRRSTLSSSSIRRHVPDDALPMASCSVVGRRSMSTSTGQVCAPEKDEDAMGDDGQPLTHPSEPSEDDIDVVPGEEDGRASGSGQPEIIDMRSTDPSTPALPSSLVPPSTVAIASPRPAPRRPLSAPPDKNHWPFSDRLRRTLLPNEVAVPSDRDDIFNLLRHVPADAVLHYLQLLRLILKRFNLLTDLGAVTRLTAAMIRCEQYACAHRLVKEADRAMERAGTPMKHVIHIYEACLTKFKRREQWDWIVWFTTSAIGSGIVSEIILRMRIRALVESNRPRQVIDTFKLFARNEILPNRAVYDDVVMSHLLIADLVGAERFLAEKAEKGFTTTLRTCLSLLDGMRTFGGNVGMEEKILSGESGKWLRDRDSAIVLNRIMSVRGDRGDLHGAYTILGYFNLELLPRPLAVPAHHFPLLADPQPTLPNSFRPQPDIATYAILMGLALRSRDIDGSLQLFQQSQDRQLGINEHLASALIRTFLAAGQLSRAREFVFDLDQGAARLSVTSSVLPQMESTTMMYQVLWKGVLQFEGLVGASRLLHRMVEEGKIKGLTYELITALIDHLAASRLHDSGLSADLIIRIARLSHGTRRATISDLNSLLQSAWKRERVYISRGRRTTNAESQSLFIDPPDPSSLTLPSIDSYLPLDPTSSVPPPSAPPPLSAATIEQVAPPVAAPTAAPSTFASFPSSMSRIQSSLSDRQILFNRTTIAQVLRRTSAFPPPQPLNMSKYLSTELIDRSIRPSARHFAIIMRAYFRVRDPNGARTIMQRALELGVRPHVAWYAVLIGGYTQMGEEELARQAYREMIECSIVPDKWLFVTLAHGLAKRGNLIAVQSVMREAENRLGEGTIQRTDPIFVGIEYRAMVMAKRHLEAQQMMRERLREGMMPDRVIWKMLRTTGKWLRRKRNARFKVEETEARERALMEGWKWNWARVTRNLRLHSPSPKDQKGLIKLERYWTAMSKQTAGRTARTVTTKKRRIRRMGRTRPKKVEKVGKVQKELILVQQNVGLLSESKGKQRQAPIAIPTAAATSMVIPDISEWRQGLSE